MSHPALPGSPEPQQPDAARQETREFAVPPVSVAAPVRRRRLLTGLAAAALLGVGVVVGVVVGQATAGTAAADTGSTSDVPVPGGTLPDATQQYGGGPGGMPPGGTGGFGGPPGSTDDDSTDGGTADDGTADGATTGDGPTQDT